ncbi:MAG: FlgO family outer membrane protein, partial [Verrucomicrobiota bacterium]|nr:FlgO family outer membrane protein [Verrucomicrobiota bacterium]
MKLGNVLAELKRRNVYKVAVAYAVVAWLLIQAASIVLPTFAAPVWTMKVLLVALVLGFPIAAAFAWAFEITPEGIVRAEDVLPNKSITRRTGSKLVAITLVMAAIAAGLFVFQFFRPRLMSGPTPASSEAATLVIADKSIAVLPFENLSSDKENAYFADGVQDEILTDLAKIADLKVISRTSVMQYKNTGTRNLREIGRQLAVAYLLEGSVQRALNRVRVNAQLIDARTDAHLWAQTYDRDLADVFAIQSEIAQTIAEQLQARLSTSERAAIAQPPTTDLVANDLFQRAQALDELANDTGAKAGLLQAVSLLEEAVRRDPKFLLAYCLLCEVHLDLYWGGFDHTPPRREQAQLALQHAERIQPEAGEVRMEKGAYAYHGFRDYDRALTEFELARRLLPNSARLYVFLASVDRRRAHWDDAVRNFEHAIQLDPRNSINFEEAGFTYAGLRREADATRILAQASALNPKEIVSRLVVAQLPYSARAEIGPLRVHLN